MGPLDYLTNDAAAVWLTVLREKKTELQFLILLHTKLKVSVFVCV